MCEHLYGNRGPLGLDGVVVMVSTLHFPLHTAGDPGKNGHYSVVIFYLQADRARHFPCTACGLHQNNALSGCFYA